jgi:hypothetical protein
MQLMCVTGKIPKISKKEKIKSKAKSGGNAAKISSSEEATSTTRTSMGNVPNSVENSTPLDRKKENKFLIPRFKSDEENPLYLLKPLDPEVAQRLARLTFEEPFIHPLDLETLQNVEEWRLDEVIQHDTEEWRQKTDTRNEQFAAFNWQRTLLFLDELRAGTHDVYCDNLAQVNYVNEVIDKYRNLMLKRSEAEKRTSRIHGDFWKSLIEVKEPKISASASSSKTAAKPNPFTAGTTGKANPGANPGHTAGYTRGYDPGSTPGATRGYNPGIPQGSARWWGSPLPESGTFSAHPRYNDPGEKSSGREFREQEEMFSEDSTANVDTNPHQDPQDNQSEKDELESFDDKPWDRDGQQTLFGSETRNTFVLSQSLVKLTPLIQENDKELTLDMVQKFVDNCRRALANGQPINILSLIPPNHQTVIDFRLMAWQRPTIRATKTPEELFQNLFILVGPQTAKVLGVEEQRTTFF